LDTHKGLLPVKESLCADQQMGPAKSKSATQHCRQRARGRARRVHNVTGLWWESTSERARGEYGAKGRGYATAGHFCWILCETWRALWDERKLCFR